MVRGEGAPVEVVFDKDGDSGAAMFQGLKAGQLLRLKAMPAAPSPKGKGEHRLYDFRELVAVDGKVPEEPATSQEKPYRGRVARFNYARHGVINGVVLDTGDFLHFKPEGYARLGLKIGDAVQADGEAQRLADDFGWAIEATEVNGRQIAKH